MVVIAMTVHDYGHSSSVICGSSRIRVGVDHSLSSTGEDVTQSS